MQSPERVRTKYWDQTRTKGVEVGMFTCNFPGCACSYTTKMGLATQKRVPRYWRSVSGVSLSPLLGDKAYSRNIGWKILEKVSLGRAPKAPDAAAVKGF